MSTEHSPIQPKPEGMPSLLGPGRGSRNNNDGRSDTQDTRILWALASDAEHAPARRATRSKSLRWATAALLLGAAGGGLAWWSIATQNVETPLTSAALAHADHAAPVVATAPVATATATPADIAASAAVAQQQAAASEPATAGAVLIDVPPTSPLAALNAADPAPSAASPAASSVATQAQPAASAVAIAAAQTKPVRKTRPEAPARRKTSTAAATPAREASPATASTTSTRTASAGRTQDADVALLEAMVAHISSGQRSGGNVSGSGTSGSGGSRISTREQLKRCKAQSGADASACRSRVCAGRWGADPDCPTLPRGTASAR